MLNSKQYIQDVCKRNRLEESANWLIRSEDDIHYIDRHVEIPPEGMEPEAACAAGLALLAQWTLDALEVRKGGLFVSTPILIVDNTWLEGMSEAPPPHILVTIAKQEDLIDWIRISGEIVAIEDCPFCQQIAEVMPFVTVTKVKPDPERESLGCWAIEPSLA